MLPVTAGVGGCLLSPAGSPAVLVLVDPVGCSVVEALAGNVRCLGIAGSIDNGSGLGGSEVDVVEALDATVVGCGGGPDMAGTGG